MDRWQRYDDLQVGGVFPAEPVHFQVTSDIVADYRAISQGSLIGGASDTDGADVAPAMLAALYIRGAQNALRGPPGGIHAKQHFTFLKPVLVGDDLFTRLTIAGKYERNGRRYVVSETSTRNRAGEEVTRGRITAIWGREE